MQTNIFAQGGKGMKLFRKRLFPDEVVYLKDDSIVYSDTQIIVTKWNVLHKKKDLHHGVSCYFLNEGCKVSKFYTEDHQLMHWYCDIAKYEYNQEKDSLLFTDLLADVIINPQGQVKVVDLAEAADILEAGKMSQQDISQMLRQLDALLAKIYSGQFDEMKKILEQYE